MRSCEGQGGIRDAAEWSYEGISGLKFSAELPCAGKFNYLRLSGEVFPIFLLEAEKLNETDRQNVQ